MAERKPCDRKSTGVGRGSAGGAVESTFVKGETSLRGVGWGGGGWRRTVKPLSEKSKMALCSNGVFSLPVPPPGGQPDPDPRGEGDPGGVGPVPAAVRPLHALHPGGAGRVHHLLLRAPALPPTHEGEAGQPGNRHQHRCHRNLSGETHPSHSEPIRRLEHAAEP